MPSGLGLVLFVFGLVVPHVEQVRITNQMLSSKASFKSTKTQVRTTNEELIFEYRLFFNISVDVYTLPQPVVLFIPVYIAVPIVLKHQIGLEQFYACLRTHIGLKLPASPPKTQQVTTLEGGTRRIPEAV